VAEAIQRAAAEVRDQKAHGSGVEHLQQRASQRVDDPDGRRRLRAGQQRSQIETPRLVHQPSLCRRGIGVRNELAGQSTG
jgi:hypothetical protein